MKIAIITDALYPFTLGGSEIRNHEIAKRLVQKGHEVHLLGLKFWEGPNEITIDGVKLFGLQAHKSLYEKNGKKPFTPPLSAPWNLFWKLRQERYDIADVCAFVFLDCYAAALACMLSKTTLVITWHQYFGDYLQGYFGLFRGTIAMTLERCSTKLSRNNLAVSHYVKQELVRAGVLEKHIAVIPNGADTKLADAIGNLEKKYDLVFVGRLNYQKNLGMMLDVLALLKKDIPTITAAIVGEGPEREQLGKKAEQLGLSNTVSFLGALKEKRDVFTVLSQSRLFILPSLLEGFPLTLVEANACGVPVITVRSKHNNTSEYILPYENGVITNPQVKDIAKAVLTLLQDKPLLDGMAKASRAKAASFDWNLLADKQELYYAKVHPTN